MHALCKRNLIMATTLARFCDDNSGATAIEYGLIGALISIAIIAAATQIGTDLGALYGAVATAVNTVVAN